MGTMRRGPTIVLALLLAVVLGSAQAVQAEDPGKILLGHTAALSGKFAKAGEQAVGGIQAIVNWINQSRGGVAVGGKKLPIEYKYYDCESKKEAVTSLLERLITSDKVNFLVAPYSSGLTLAGAPVAEKYGMVYLDHGGASDKIFKQGFHYVVQTIGPGSRYHVGTLDMIKKIDPSAKRLALAYEDSEFARSVLEGAEEHAKKLGFEIVFNRTYPAKVTDLTPLLSDLKASNPDIVIGGGHFADGQLFAQQMADLGINPKALSLIAAVTLPAFEKALKERAEGAMGPSHWEYGVTFSKEKAGKAGQTWIGPGQDEFVSLFKKAVGKDVSPDYHAAEAGASVLALVLGIEKANSLDPDKVRAALGELTFTSFYGEWDIDDTGKQVGHSMVDAQWQGGTLKIVWPEDAATAKPVYPRPAVK
ncbi:MAG: amino acid ABC transporter substrate-binding protein [Deltaproteobacteria bacterium]